MKLKKIVFAALFITIIIVACSPDDGSGVTRVPDRDRAEQQIADKDSLTNYLSTHYYNSGELSGLTNPGVADIVITKLEDDDTVPDNATLLASAVETKTTTFEDTSYEYYVLKINQGGGESPKFTDFLRVKYEGSSVETGDVFDFRIAQPLDINLIFQNNDNQGAIRAWQLVFPDFNAAESFTTNSGDVDFDNFGLGVMFIPSGLAYFSGAITGRSYDNLIFKFELLQFEENDADNDGIPSYVEDLNSNLNAFDEDTDDDNIPNYLDIDDDGDGIFTINELLRTEYLVDTNNGDSEPVLNINEYEISRTEENGVITIETVTALDTNNNSKLDYLDAEVTTDYSEDN